MNSSSQIYEYLLPVPILTDELRAYCLLCRFCDLSENVVGMVLEEIVAGIIPTCCRIRDELGLDRVTDDVVFLAIEEDLDIINQLSDMYINDINPSTNLNQVIDTLSELNSLTGFGSSYYQLDGNKLITEYDIDDLFSCIMRDLLDWLVSETLSALDMIIASCCNDNLSISFVDISYDTRVVIPGYGSQVNTGTTMTDIYIILNVANLGERVDGLRQVS
jgi:hypothetical protein